MWNAHDAGEKLGKRMVARGPTAAGLLGVGAGLALLGLNFALVRYMDMVLPVTLIIGCFSVPLGLWTLATQRTHKTPDNPRWWTAGYYGLFALGLGLGFYLAYWYAW